MNNYITLATLGAVLASTPAQAHPGDNLMDYMGFMTDVLEQTVDLETQYDAYRAATDVAPPVLTDLVENQRVQLKAIQSQLGELELMEQELDSLGLVDLSTGYETITDDYTTAFDYVDLEPTPEIEPADFDISCTDNDFNRDTLDRFTSAIKLYRGFLEDNGVKLNTPLIRQIHRAYFDLERQIAVDIHIFDERENCQEQPRP